MKLGLGSDQPVSLYIYLYLRSVRVCKCFKCCLHVCLQPQSTVPLSCERVFCVWVKKPELCVVLPSSNHDDKGQLYNRAKYAYPGYAEGRDSSSRSITPIVPHKQHSCEHSNPSASLLYPSSLSVVTSHSVLSYRSNPLQTLIFLGSGIFTSNTQCTPGHGALILMLEICTCVIELPSFPPKSLDPQAMGNFLFASDDYLS